MKKGKQTARGKGKKAEKRVNHPRSKPEMIRTKRSEPDQAENPVPDSHDTRLINPNKP